MPYGPVSCTCVVYTSCVAWLQAGGRLPGINEFMMTGAGTRAEVTGTQAVAHAGGSGVITAAAPSEDVPFSSRGYVVDLLAGEGAVAGGLPSEVRAAVQAAGAAAAGRPATSVTIVDALPGSVFH